jgi:hypothetical protein
MALRLGNRMALDPHCRASETGVGVPQDLVHAASCFMRMQARGTDTSRDIARVTKNMSEADISRARQLLIPQDPAPEFLADYAPRVSAPTLQMTPPAASKQP